MRQLHKNLLSRLSFPRGFQFCLVQLSFSCSLRLLCSLRSRILRRLQLLRSSCCRCSRIILQLLRGVREQLLSSSLLLCSLVIRCL